MERVLEPELMNDPEQALAYASSDFSVPHEAFVAHLLRLFPSLQSRTFQQSIADLGCGSADISLRIARALPNAFIVGFDGAENMLKLGRRAIEAEGLGDRISLYNRRLPDHSYLTHAFDAVVSNSLLHHLPDPQALWRPVRELGKAFSPVLVMDLIRPESDQRARELVDLHAQGAPEQMRQDFFHSLKAAFTPEEVKAQLEYAGLRFKTEVVSDRHMLIHGHL